MSDDVEQRVVADPDLAPALEVHALPSAPAPVAADRVPVAGGALQKGSGYFYMLFIKPFAASRHAATCASCSRWCLLLLLPCFQPGNHLGESLLQAP